MDLSQALAKLFPPAPLAVVNGVNGMNGQAHATRGGGDARGGRKTAVLTAKKNSNMNEIQVNECCHGENSLVEVLYPIGTFFGCL